MAKNPFKAFAKKAEDEHQKRLERCIPVAYEIIAVLARAAQAGTLDLGDITEKSGQPKDSVEKSYNLLAQEVTAAMLKANLPLGDKKFVFQLALQGFEQTQIRTLASIDLYTDNALEKMFHKPYIDLTLKDLDDIIKAQSAAANKTAS